MPTLEQQQQSVPFIETPHWREAYHAPKDQMKTYPHHEGGEIIELVRKDEHDEVVAELLERLRERTESHLAASARDVATIQRQAVEITKWQALTETLATALRDISAHDGPGFPHGTCSDIADQALDDYDAAKAGNMPDPLDEAVKRMEAVSIDPWVEVPSKHAALDGLRNELILAAKGESA